MTEHIRVVLTDTRLVFIVQKYRYIATGKIAIFKIKNLPQLVGLRQLTILITLLGGASGLIL